MIKFDEFYRTIGDLEVGQDAVIYADGEKTPRAYFKKFAEYGKNGILVYDVQAKQFGVVQDSYAMSFSVSLMGFYEDLCNNCVDFCVKVRNREFFTIGRVAREDLDAIGFDTSEVDDSTMDRLADKLGDDYCEQLFWISLDIIADECLGIPRKDDELS